jgi:tRNA threonylcarbamoyladenosine biosynthesis protein TsaE
MQIITHSEKDNLEVAKNFLENISPKDKAVVVGLYGNLGAGKTAFTKAIAKNFGVEDTITSPTFVIEKIYELTNQKFKHLIHIDAYRLEKEQELVSLGWNEITGDPENIIFIEWPERVIGIIPEHIKIQFTTLPDENSRQIDIEE